MNLQEQKCFEIWFSGQDLNLSVIDAKHTEIIELQTSLLNTQQPRKIYITMLQGQGFIYPVS